MNPNRLVPGPSSALRKSRLEGKPSMLPKPRRPGSTDRLSSEARRPSAAGHRSSSAEPPRAIYGGGRLSREASATKVPATRRSRSQQSYMTPLRSSHFSVRQTTTPRTPSEDRSGRSWQMSLDRALAYVAVKDQRNISNVAWQRQEMVRVQEGLAAGGKGPGAVGALIRPLTIARFVEIVGGLLVRITADAKLNTDNYVTRLPHLMKRLLYPGNVSKSWLKTVNTLHAFPHALALISYLLALVNHIEMPVSDEWLYVEKDDLARLRRDYVKKCWIRFQSPNHEYEDLNKEYLHNLKLLLGNDDEKIMELQQIIKKYTACLEDESETLAAQEEARLEQRNRVLEEELRTERAARAHIRAEIERLKALRATQLESLDNLEQKIQRDRREVEQVRSEVERQQMSVEQRTRLLDEVDYSQRVLDSKLALLDQVAKMVQSKEVELALWQRKTLDSCREYKQGLIHLYTHFPNLQPLDIDEKDLMLPECLPVVTAGLETLAQLAEQLKNQHAHAVQERSRIIREHHQLLEENLAAIAELKSILEQEQQAHESEKKKEAAEAAACAHQVHEINTKLDQINANQDKYKKIDAELKHWEEQDKSWRTKLAEMHEYIREKKEEMPRALEAATAKRTQLVKDKMRGWNDAMNKKK